MQYTMETALELALAQQDPDIELVEQTCEGCKTAFDVLFERHKQFIYNVCYRMLGSSDDAVDATQAAFINAYKAINNFHRTASFRSWLCRVAINTSMEMIRQKRRRRMLNFDIARHPAPEASGDNVWEAILELPPDMRAVIVLFYFHGLSTEEIAESVGCSGSATRTRLHRARALFKKKYEDLEI